MPQAPTLVPARHIDPEQQPFGQLVALQPAQTPPLQASPCAHIVQA